MSRNKLYLLLSGACLAGSLWLLVNIHDQASGGPDICPFKLITGLPCPACGSTRAVFALLEGNLTASIRLNPFGIIITLILIASPFWIGYDIIKRGDSLLSFYTRIEVLLKQREIAIPTTVLVLFNWAWNIYKGV